MESSTFTIEGMTCQSCVKTIKESIASLTNIGGVDVSLEKKTVEITANRKIGLSEVTSALATSPKYKVSDITELKKESLLKIYKPLITIFSFILLASLAYQVSTGTFHSHIFMNHLMAGFFLGLSFFKFLDLKSFAESFSGYDPLGQRWLNYGFIYPFIELGLGLMFIAQVALNIANLLTIIVLTITTFGVYRRLQSKSKFQCACLGTAFKLPLSNVTIAENITMIAMAIYGLLLHY